VNERAVTFGTTVNSGIFLVGSKPRSDKGFSWIWEEVMQKSRFRNMEKNFLERISSLRKAGVVRFAERNIYMYGLYRENLR